MSQHILPVILSLPHGGFGVPDQLSDRLALTQTDIYNECDLWIDELFDFASMDPPGSVDVLDHVTMPIARAIVDVNRAPDDLDNPDGPIKEQSSYGRATCAQPLSRREKQDLIDSHWEPFHASLAKSLKDQGANAHLFLDSHNMAQMGPATYAEPGAARPLICLGNLGGPDGSGSARNAGSPATCSPEYIQHAAAIADDVFGDIRLLEPQPGPPPPTVAINQPYPGGYILREYARKRQANDLPPGMMIELNRGLYVGNQNAHTPVAPPNMERIALLRERLYMWLTRLLETRSI